MAVYFCVDVFGRFLEATGSLWLFGMTDGYTYDDLGRLTDADYLVDSGTPDHEDSFVMDALGNRTGNQTLRDEGTVNFTVDSATNRYQVLMALSCFF